MGQTSPGLTPEIFAPNLISRDDEHEFGSVFSADASEFYYAVDIGGRAEVRFTQLINGGWTPPAVLISHPQFSYNDPFLSPDENRLYYISDMPFDGTTTAKNYDIWYSVRTDTGWSEPHHAGDAINTAANEYYISFTADGSLYFASNVAASEDKHYDYDIYKSRLEEGVFQSPVRLGDGINSSQYEADVFVAPDESYLIFSSVRKGGYGQGDLYISFKDENGNWKEAGNMGELVNTSGHELCPFVTQDGKYLFYTSNKDIYWIDAAVLRRYQ
ncbi:hypothetical protein AT746_18295 [Lacimicrobium alkaliphilum]|uniref:Uncharacterized protein n=1 Tax=Lacimicrobium alkaliphilum TaxID=1526571 RepID=A0A0U3BFY5_9ALTE|nr:hypothetical protein AT746_18295 [Lacimicrobium alkaliphilum]